MLTKRDLLRSAALAAITVTTTKPVPAKRRPNAEWPDILEAKDIAEEGFIYGLPIVMNYAVMYEYAVDQEFGAVQGAVQSDQERGARLHLQGHGHHHAEQRHAVFAVMAGSARRADRPFGAGCGESRYYSVMLCDGNTFNYGYIGSRATGSEAGDYMVVGPDWKGRPRPASRRFFSPRRNFLSLPTARSFSMRQTCRMSRRSRPATRCSRCPPI